MGDNLRLFFVVLARDASQLERKLNELNALGYPYVVVCGEKTGFPNVVYREPKGKFDAVNYGLKFVPQETDVIAFNDVDAEIHNFDAALTRFLDKSIALEFVRVQVTGGPQVSFYSFLDALRKRIPIAASGELMLVRREFLERILPLKRCKAEDSYILFKILENGGKAVFCEDCYVLTERTSSPEQEESYKRRTVGGIYQALSMSKPPFAVRLFYSLLPFVSPLLLVLGKNGYYWSKGILLGFVDYARGDTAGFWKSTYS
jgi:cellulose synthase/poly-beta-1,6-N-acetylglucosamine synthase-like glycosyltransferase